MTRAPKACWRCVGGVAVAYDARGLNVCAKCVTREPCDACGAEPGEPCRFGCLGYAIEHGELAGTEPCS